MKVKQCFFVQISHVLLRNIGVIFTVSIQYITGQIIRVDGGKQCFPV